MQPLHLNPFRPAPINASPVKFGERIRTGLPNVDKYLDTQSNKLGPEGKSALEASGSATVASAFGLSLSGPQSFLPALLFKAMHSIGLGSLAGFSAGNPSMGAMTMSTVGDIISPDGAVNKVKTPK